uniref:Reverse transcriptase zinc-binding domain-containing protein n=1 Tax=Oreochromis aureus TaxID=47969 RepID=A0AAZ1XSB8_OREAU
MSRELRSRLVQFKILNRVYWTPSRLHRVGLATDDACWKCQQGSGTLLHLLWGCSKVQDYWTHIHTVVEKVVGQRVPFMNSLYVLGDPSALSHLPTPLAHWVQTLNILVIGSHGDRLCLNFGRDTKRKRSDISAFCISGISFSAF